MPTHAIYWRDDEDFVDDEDYTLHVLFAGPGSFQGKHPRCVSDGHPDDFGDR